MNLSGQAGELRFTLQITRKETGKVEQVELVGNISESQLKELSDGCNTLDGSEKRGD